jgi:hypothetical protein
MRATCAGEFVFVRRAGRSLLPMSHTRRAPSTGTCRPNRALPPKWCFARARISWQANALHCTSLCLIRRWTPLNFGCGIHRSHIWFSKILQLLHFTNRSMNVFFLSCDDQQAASLALHSVVLESGESLAADAASKARYRTPHLLCRVIENAIPPRVSQLASFISTTTLFKQYSRDARHTRTHCPRRIPCRAVH